MAIDTYRLPYSFERTNLTQLQQLAERGHLQFFNDNGRIGYIDIASKEVRYLTQTAGEVEFDSKYFTGGLVGVSNTLQGLAKYIDELSPSDIPVSGYDGNLSTSTDLAEALAVLDELITVGSITATDIPLDTSEFNALLSSSDTDVQKALNTLDNHLHDDQYYTKEEIDDKLSVDIATSSDVSETSEVSLLNKTDINIIEGGITVSVSDEVNNQRVTFRNKTLIDSYLNFDIELQNVVYTAPVTIKAGEVFDLTYDSNNTRWVF